MARELPIKNGRLASDLDAAGFRINNLPPGSGFTQAQADWNQTDTSAVDFIKNKPTIPAAVTIDYALSPTSTNPVQNRVVNQALTLSRNVSLWVPEVTSSGEHIINGPLVFDTEGGHWSDSPIEIWDRNGDVVGPGQYRVDPNDDGYDDPDAVRIGLIEAEDESADPEVYLYLRRYEGYILDSQEDKPLAGIVDLPDVSGKENAGNKVTSLSAASTDAQYPSAKCVYDGLAGKADKASLPYALVDVTVTNGTATLTDRAINAVSLSAAATLAFPAVQTTGKARDFVVRLTLVETNNVVPSVTFPADVEYETEGGEWPDLTEAGTYIVRLTEVPTASESETARFFLQCSSAVADATPPSAGGDV